MLYVSSQMSKERPHPSINPQTIHPPIGGGVYTILNLQTEWKYLDLFICYNILTDLGGHSFGDGWVGWMGV